MNNIAVQVVDMTKDVYQGWNEKYVRILNDMVSYVYPDHGNYLYPEGVK